MDKTTSRLLEITHHLDAITEEMQESKIVLLQSPLLKFYAEEIKELTNEMTGLLGSSVESGN